jgi:hypothetical protein
MRVINDSWAWHKNAMAKENHPPLLKPGEGLRRMARAVERQNSDSTKTKVKVK